MKRPTSQAASNRVLEIFEGTRDDFGSYVMRRTGNLKAVTDTMGPA